MPSSFPIKAFKEDEDFEASASFLQQFDEDETLRMILCITSS